MSRPTWTKHEKRAIARQANGIAAVQLAQLVAVGFGLKHAARGDWQGFVIMLALWAILRLFLPHANPDLEKRARELDGARRRR